MATDSTLIEATFEGGLDERSDGAHIQPGKLYSLVNGRFDKRGRIDKRMGFADNGRALTAGLSDLSTGHSLAANGDELILCDDTYIYTRSSAASVSARRDLLPNCTTNYTMFGHSRVGNGSPDVAYGNGMFVHVWIRDYAYTNACSIMAAIYDATTGGLLYGPAILHTATNIRNPKVVIVSSTIAVVTYANVATGVIYGRTIDLSGTLSAFGTETSLVTAAAGVGDIYDICTCDSGGFALAFYDGTSFFVKRLNTSLSITATQTIETVAAGTQGAIALRHSSGSRLWLAYSDSFGATRLRAAAVAENVSSILTAAFTVTTTAGVAEQITFALNSTLTKACVIAAYQGASGWTTITQSITSAGATEGASRTTSFVVPASKPIEYGSKAYILIQRPSTEQGSLFLVDANAFDLSSDIYPFRVVSNVAPRLTQSHSRQRSSLSFAPATATGQYAIAAELEPANSSAFVMRIKADFTTPKERTFGQLGRSIHMTGGVPAYFDGRICSEQGFHLWPESSLITATKHDPGGSISNGTRLYCATYEWIDARGELHESAPSAPISVTFSAGTGTEYADIAVPYLHLTAREDIATAFTPHVSIVLYRTVAGGTTFYRETSIVTGTAENNDPNGGLTSLSSTMSDATLQTKKKLYTDGDVLENVCPPSANAMVIHKNRIWLACGRTIWFSQFFEEGMAPGRFNEALTFAVGDQDDITALGTIGEVLIIFKKNAIYAVYGDGPALNGTGSDLTEPKSISDGIGTTQVRSVVSTPSGIFFRADRGFYLLTRSLELQYVGAEIENTAQTYPYVTSAVYEPNAQDVRFTVYKLYNGSVLTTDGQTLVYSLAYNAWAVWQPKVSADAGGLTVAYAACMHLTRYKYLTYDGRLLSERKSTESDCYKDQDLFIPIAMTSAWFKPAAIQGFMRVWKMGLLVKPVTAASLYCFYYKNYSESGIQTASYTDTEMTAAANGASTAQLSIHMKEQLMDTVRVYIVEAAPASGLAAQTGQGLQFLGLSWEVGVEKGPHRHTTAERK